MNSKKSTVSLFASFVLFLLFVLLLVFILLRVDKTNETNRLEQLQGAVRNACVTCFAVEGRYPDSMDYLREHYGLNVDDNKYIVEMDSFADNIMPEISIIVRGNNP